MAEPHDAPAAPREEIGDDDEPRILNVRAVRRIGDNVRELIAESERRLLAEIAQLRAEIEARTWQGVYKRGETYKRHNMVTFHGSMFIATRDTTVDDAPEHGDAFRLCLKRGRDG